MESTVNVARTVEYMGSYYGWKRGVAAETCRNYSAEGGGVLLCQNVVNAATGQGNSGAPVFEITNSPQQNDVKLLGILWGASGNQFMYSPIGNIYMDLGPNLTWDSCDPSQNC